MSPLLLALLAIPVALFFAALTRRKRAKAARSSRSALPTTERWVQRQVARAFGDKTSTLDEQDVLTSFTTAPEPHVVEAFEELVQSVELIYERMPSRPTELTVQVRFEDGSQTQARRSLGDNELPADIAQDFARTGASRVHRPWQARWAR